jgi:hypothetical protein
MANQVLPNPGRALDLNGYISPGAKATFYQSGTDTLITVYSDRDETVVAANPAIADANGVFPQRYANGQVKVVITTSDDVTLYTLDPAPTVQSTGAGASQISFVPTVELPFSNVQSAIVGAAALAVSGFADFGLGVTGNTTLLANIDATNLGAGIYRFDGTTTGTLPTGVAAADTGLVEHWRQSAATAMQMLYHATSDRVFHRRMATTTWGTWREVITSNQAPATGDILYRGASSWTRLAIGTTGQQLRVTGGLPVWESGSWTQLALTSISAGVPGAFTVPAGATEIEMFFDRVSQDSSGNWVVRIGPSSGVVSSGYEGGSGNRGAEVQASTGFVILCGASTREQTGRMKLTLMNAGTNLWVSDHTVADGATGQPFTGGGRVALSGGLERISLAITGGGNADGGQIRIQYR